MSSISFASPLIVADDGIIVDGAKVKIEQIDSELYEKTGVSIVLYVKKSLNNESIFDYEKNISSTLKEPFVLIVFAENEKKVDIVVKPESLDKIVDKNYILNNRIIPILGAAGDKNSPESRYSASLLNGIGEIADKIAESKNATLDSSLGSQTSSTMNIVRAVFYGILALAAGVLIYRRFIA
ncbi:MAG: hypothetical protein RL154_925 [Pseudomonadota bacterium]